VACQPPAHQSQNPRPGERKRRGGAGCGERTVQGAGDARWRQL